ncbi:nitrogen fixation protein NifZ [Vibrio sp. PP-XX7]
MMSEAVVRFPPGTVVRLVRNVRNDGSFTDLRKGELLVAAGTEGIIRTYGYWLQTQVIYQVFFPDVQRVIGIREAEVIDAGLEWVPCRFRVGDKARLRYTLTMQSRCLSRKGEMVDIHRVHRDLDTGQLKYEIILEGLHFHLEDKVLSTLESCADIELVAQGSEEEV